MGVEPISPSRKGGVLKPIDERAKYLRVQRAGRRSNPRLLVFSQVLHRLSYRPQPRKKPDVAETPGFERAPFGFGPRVNSAADARATYSPADRRCCLSIVVRWSIQCKMLSLVVSSFQTVPLPGSRCCSDDLLRE